MSELIECEVCKDMVYAPYYCPRCKKYYCKDCVVVHREYHKEKGH